MSPSKLYSVTEAAKFLKVSRERVLVFIREGRLKAEKIVGNWVITEKDLKKFAAVPRETGKYLKPRRPRAQSG